MRVKTATEHIPGATRTGSNGRQPGAVASEWRIPILHTLIAHIDMFCFLQETVTHSRNDFERLGHDCFARVRQSGRSKGRASPHALLALR